MMEPAADRRKKMEEKSVKDSSIMIIHQMMHSDANLAGNVHGGVIMKLIDNTAGIVAGRHAGCNVVTAFIDKLDFHSPVFIGDLLRIQASINYVGTTSMEVGVRVEAENHLTGEVRHTASAYLTFVALDKNAKAIEVPRLKLETEDEIRRNKAAMVRRDARTKMKELKR
jgi:acyl-CoA hydrolase